jgi:hypothetical protein
MPELSSPGLCAGGVPVEPGKMVRYCENQPDLSIVEVDPQIKYVRMGAYIVGIIDPWCPAGFMKVI